MASTDKMEVDTPDPAAPSAMTAAAKARAAAAAASGKPKDRFQVAKWNAVAIWAFDMAVDNCAICKHHVTELCMECMVNPGSVNTEDCAIAWGLCNHAFHFHCISHWLKKHNYCPLDNRQWELQKYGKL